MKRYIVSLRKKDVVKERDPQQLTGLLESPGNVHILGAWLKLARCVVVPNYEVTRPDQDCTLENHPSGNGRRSGGSEGHEREGHDVMRAVQVEREEMLSHRFGETNPYYTFPGL